MRKKLLILFTLFTLLLSLSACTGHRQRRPDDDTLYVGSVQTSFPTAFMPWLSREGLAPTIASMLYNSLFSYDEDSDSFVPIIGKEWYYVDQHGEPIVTDAGGIDYDRLEELYGSPEHDYLAVKVILHDDVTWSDGEPLTVEDVHYTFDIATNNQLSNHAGALAWTSDLQHRYQNGVLTKRGVFTYNHGAAAQGYVIDEADKDTVMYLHVNKVLGSVMPLFSSILILPKHIWEPVVSVDNPLNNTTPSSETLFNYQNPVGSGHYVLDTDRSSSQQIILHRRKDYHLKDDDGGNLYKVDTINFMLYQEINVAIYALLKGHIDVLDTSVSANYLRLFEQEDDLFLSNAPGTFTQTLVLNVNPVASERNPQRDLLQNPDFRKAMALAINQENLIENVLSGAGRSTSPGLMRETMGDIFNPDADFLPADSAERLAIANDLLDAIVPDKDSAGYRLLDGERIQYSILGHPGEQDVVSFLEIQLQKIGIAVEYTPKGSQPETTYLYTSRFDMTLQGVIFSISNVDIMYRAHFCSLGRSSNYGRLINPELTEKVDAMRFTLNLNYKYELIDDIQLIIAEQYYKLPLYTSNIISVARTDRYTGYVVVEGATVFNSQSLQNLTKVEGE